MALTDKHVDATVPIDERVAAAIRCRLEDGRLPCAAAAVAAVELGVPPLEVGRTADRLPVHLTACQLGLFGYPGHAKGWAAAGVASLPVPAGLSDSLRAAQNERGEIGCARLWEEAERFAAPRLQVGWLADQLGLRIRDCQLGAF